MSKPFETIEYHPDRLCPNCNAERVGDFRESAFIYGHDESTYIDSGYGEDDLHAKVYRTFYERRCPNCNFTYLFRTIRLGNGDEYDKWGKKQKDGDITVDSIRRWRDSGYLRESLPNYISYGKVNNLTFLN